MMAASEARPRSRTARKSCSLLLKCRNRVTSLTPAFRAISRVVAPRRPSLENVCAAASRRRSRVRSVEEALGRLRSREGAAARMQVLTCISNQSKRLLAQFNDPLVPVLVAQSLLCYLFRPMTANRRAYLQRETAETYVSVDLVIDGSGTSSIQTGIPFFDHMLTLLSKHSLFDLKIDVRGDL